MSICKETLVAIHDSLGSDLDFAGSKLRVALDSPTSIKGDEVSFLSEGTRFGVSEILD